MGVYKKNKNFQVVYGPKNFGNFRSYLNYSEVLYHFLLMIFPQQYIPNNWISFNLILMKLIPFSGIQRLMGNDYEYFARFLESIYYYYNKTSPTAIGRSWSSLFLILIAAPSTFDVRNKFTIVFFYINNTFLYNFRDMNLGKTLQHHITA